MLFLLLAYILMPITFAQTNDEMLRSHIEKFKIRALPPPPKNKPLYELGYKLFHDKNLSGKGNISCQSCHSHDGYSGDTLPLGVGEGAEGMGEKRIQKDGLVLARHTPAIYNLGYAFIDRFFWDGRVSMKLDGTLLTPEPKLNGKEPELKAVVDTLDSMLAVQAIFPLTSPEEMLGKESKLTKVEAWDQVLKKIFKGPFQNTYKELFKAAFPGVTDFNIGHVGNALAELERGHFQATNTLWDLYLRGNKKILTERMKSGALVFFGQGRCTNCHAGILLSNFGSHNIGVPQLGPGVNGHDDKGRYEVTKSQNDLYQFRVPPLRNVGVTAPYMHTGAFRTLWDVINHYNDPVASIRHFNWDSKLPRYRDSLNLDSNSVNADNRERTLSKGLARTLDLTQEQRTDLFCFLAVALTDVSLQKDLITKGIANEVSDCAPRPL